MHEKTVKLEKVIPFSVLKIFDGGTIEDVREKLEEEYAKLQPILDEGKFITFGYDSNSNDTFIKIWRMETDRDFEIRMKRIENINRARENYLERKRTE